MEEKITAEDINKEIDSLLNNEIIKMLLGETDRVCLCPQKANKISSNMIVMEPVNKILFKYVSIIDILD